MLTFLLILYLVLCILLVIAILIQSDKGTSIAGVFGGGSDTFLGASSAVTWLNKITTYLAVAFLVLSFVLSIVPLMGGKSPTSRFGNFDETPAETQQMPAAPEGQAPGEPSEGAIADTT